MELFPIGNEATAAPGPNRFAQLSSEDFVRILFTELKSQDPFQPQDSSALLEQLSSLRNIESQMSLQDQLRNLVLQNQVASAGNLIGKLVAGLDEANRQVSGLVTSVRMNGDRILLELDTGHQLDMSRITAIAEPNPPVAEPV